MDPLFLGGAALSARLNAFGANSAKKSQAATLKSILKQYKALLGEQSAAGKQALQAQQAGLQSIESGFAGALAETNRLGDAAEVAARDQAKVGMGQGAQMLINRGMYNPDQVQAWNRGISSDLMRMISENNARTASSRAGILAQGGLAAAGQQGQIAGQIGQNFGQRAGITDAMLGFQAQQQPIAQDYSNDIGWLFSALRQNPMSGSGAVSKPSYFKGKPMSPVSPNPYQMLPFKI